MPLPHEPSPRRNLACPDCGLPLEPSRRGSVEIDVCTGCYGVWLDRGELVALAGRSMGPGPTGEFELTPASRTGMRPCPLCGVAMAEDRDPGTGIVIDHCPEHGIWLDAGELEAIRAHRHELPAAAPGALSALLTTRERPIDGQAAWIVGLLLVDTEID